MMPPDEIEALILRALPDARVEIEDLTGTRDHYSMVVTSAAFSGKSRIAQQRMIYDALGGAVGGPIHALALKTRAPSPDTSTAEQP